MERRAFQVLIAVLSLIPVAGLVIAWGPGPAIFYGADAPPIPTSLDNQWRYLSGVYLSVSLAIWWTLPAIESRLVPIRFAAAGVFLGGIGRVVSIAKVGLPDEVAMIAGLVLELVVAPLLVVWQIRLARVAPAA